MGRRKIVMTTTKIKDEGCKLIIRIKQAGAELGQAQLQLELGFTLIQVCCIILMITNYYYISLSTISL